MKKPILTILAAIALLTPTVRAEIGIISPEEAKAMIENPDASQRPIVLDTRGGYKDYFRGHLPTAQHINFDTLRGTDQGVPVQYLPEDLTKALLIRAGINKDRVHLIYATGDVLPNDEILSASMVAHVLEKYGVKDIHIVDGGLLGWTRAGLTPTQEYFANAPGVLPAEGNPGVAADINAVLAEKDQEGVILVDARPKNEYLGQDDIWLRKGHIPGAKSFHWARLMEADNTHKFKPFAEVKADLEAAGITPDEKVICYCGTSREGSLVAFYLKHVADYPNVRLYEGAWKEYVWLKNKSLPTETEDPSAK